MEENMTDDWGLAIQKSDWAREALLKITGSGKTQEILNALDALDEAEREREIATVKAGHLPAWTPSTDEGLARWGVTREQVNEWVARPRH